MGTQTIVMSHIYLLSSYFLLETVLHLGSKLLNKEDAQIREKINYTLLGLHDMLL